jgi:hypothetical protein
MASGSNDIQGGQIRIQRAMAARLKALKEVEAEIVSFVRTAVSRTLRAAGDPHAAAPGIVHHVMTSAILASDEAGAGLLIGAKNTAKGLVLGVQDVGGDAAAAAKEAARASVAATETIGVDTGMVVHSIIEGVAEAIIETGANPGEVLREAALVAASGGRRPAPPGTFQTAG